MGGDFYEGRKGWAGYYDAGQKAEAPSRGKDPETKKVSSMSFLKHRSLNLEEIQRTVVTMFRRRSQLELRAN